MKSSILNVFKLHNDLGKARLIFRWIFRGDSDCFYLCNFSASTYFILTLLI